MAPPCRAGLPGGASRTLFLLWLSDFVLAVLVLLILKPWFHWRNVALFAPLVGLIQCGRALGSL